MLLYNITFIVDDAVADAWQLWMQEEHIPRVLATGKFVSNRLLKVIDSPNEGVTFCSQYIAEKIEDYQEYQDRYAPELALELDKFKDKLVAFRSLMEFVD
jgi:hypothetical protein